MHSATHRYRVPLTIVAISLYAALAVVSAVSGRGSYSVIGLLILLTVLLWPSLVAARRGAWLLWAAAVLILGTALATGFARAALDSLAIVINAAVGWTFARTLKAGREPLIATLVRLVDGDAQLRAPGVAGYARMLTRVWAVVMCLQAAVLLLIWMQLHFGIPFSFSAGQSVWVRGYLSYGNYLVIGLLFVVEYPWRRYRLKHIEHLPFLVASRRIAGNWQQLMRDSIR